MNPAEIRDLVRPRPWQFNSQQRLLSNCHDINDLRTAAKRRVPRPVFDYVDGGADNEETLAANTASFARHRFVPRVLRDVSDVDLATTIFGRPVAMPVVLGPTGYTRMMHPDGELAVAAAAAKHQLPYVLSTVSTTSVENVAAAGHPDLWFQLYLRRNRALAMELVRRAADQGYHVLEITVDAAQSGRRVRDVRNGLTIPPQLTGRSLLDIATKPRYWSRMLRSEPIIFANAPIGVVANVETITQQFDPSTTWAELDELRAAWPGSLVLKGLVGPADARHALDCGVDAIHLSNHGGRQLDRCATPLEMLPTIREEVGPQATVFLDSGVRHGADVVTALALGADAVMIGRVYLYGLMAAGQPGVEHALTLMRGQFERTMRLLGLSTLAELRSAGPAIFQQAASR